jgi:hypothetical protein
MDALTAAYDAAGMDDLRAREIVGTDTNSVGIIRI